MQVQELFDQARDTMTVKKVYGEPYVHEGITIIPAAKIRGGVGGGAGEGPNEQGKGWGGGYGLTARPVGAYVIRDGTVTYVPAIDVNRILLVAGVIAIFALGTVRSIVKTLAKR